jgi:hypothetical protein
MGIRRTIGTIVASLAFSAMTAGAAFAEAPVITKISPQKSVTEGGVAVTIVGTGLFATSAVHVGSLEATSFMVISATRVTAVVPAEEAGIVHVTVTTPEGTSAATTPSKFSFYPTITSITPNSGLAAHNNPITVTGTGFKVGTKGTGFRFPKSKLHYGNCPTTTECTLLTPTHTPGSVDGRALVNKVISPVNSPYDEYNFEPPP